MEYLDVFGQKPPAAREVSAGERKLVRCSVQLDKISTSTRNVPILNIIMNQI